MINLKLKFLVQLTTIARAFFSFFSFLVIDGRHQLENQPKACFLRFSSDQISAEDIQVCTPAIPMKGPVRVGVLENLEKSGKSGMGYKKKWLYLYVFLQNICICIVAVSCV